MPSKTSRPILPAVPNVTVFDVLVASRPVTATSVEEKPAGGTKTSRPAVVPYGVATVSAPDDASEGTATVRLVAVAAVTRSRRPASATTLSVTGAVWNPVPVMLSVAPGATTGDAILVTAGPCGGTMKDH